MRKLLTILLLLLLLIFPVAALAEGEDTLVGDELLYNGDFSVYSDSAQLPAGWELSAYYSDSSSVLAATQTDDTGDLAISIENLTANDARVGQIVTVKPNTTYKLSAKICTTDVQYGTGASLSIDNYAIDGTYCYSENLFGSDDWRTVSLYFKTGPEQSSVNVALRLGGYGTTATGQAEFKSVSLMECTSTSADVVDLLTENGTVSGSGGSVEQAASQESQDAKGKFILALAVTAILTLCYLWFYNSHARFDGRTLNQTNRPGFALTLILLGAFVLRMMLSMIFYGHPTDINCFMAWGNMVLDGTSKFYTSGAFADYPPGYMYICGALSWICRVLGIPYGSTGMALLFKLPSTAADLVGTWLLYRIAKQYGASETVSLIVAGLFAFCPVLAFVSGAWGQIDSILALLLVVVILLLQKNKRILAGAVYGLAILIKPQALMLGPLLAVAYVVDILDAKQDWPKRLLETILAVFSAFAVLIVLSLPFKGTQNWYWLAVKYAPTASSYNYASIEAFNLGALLGGNWKSADMLVLGFIPFKVIGMLGIALSTAFSAVLYMLGRKRGAGALFLSGAVGAILIFCLGHYMHERYMLPALMLLLAAYAFFRDRRLLIAFGGISLTAFLNITCAMYVVNHQAARGPFYDGITYAGSALMLISAAYLCYVAVSILLCGRSPEPLRTEREKAEEAEEAEEAVETEEAGEEGEPRPPKPPKPLKLPEPILPLQSMDTKLRYTRRDIFYVLAITLVYGIVALTNLGSLHVPQTFWQSDVAGESFTVQFPKNEHVAYYSLYGNIDQDGTLLIKTNEGYEETFAQTYDDMFRWKRVPTDFTADSVTLSVYSGSLKLNEMAFFDDEGNLLPVTLVGASESQAKLFDEQKDVDFTPTYFNGMYFDELYHGRTAYENLHNLTPYENSHPPLGKLLIMLGVWVFGMVPFGWRVVGTLFGIGMLPVLYAFGKRLFKNSDYALTLTVLFAFDFMHFTQTRIATIDVYSVFFILLMYYYMYIYITMNFFTDGLKKTLKPLFLSGLFFGIGAACKWTSIYAGAGLAVLLFGSLIARYIEYKRAESHGTPEEIKKTEDYWYNTVKTLLWCCLFFLVIPFTIYFASYTPYFIYEAGQNAGNYGLKGMFDTFTNYQSFMYNYHANLHATHPYQSSWYSWPFTIKPMWYFYNTYLNGDAISTLTASGNPAVWWVSSIGAIVLLALRMTNRIKPDRALQIFFVGVLANYLPWVLVTRCTFIYHFFATVPFILMATVYALQKLEKKFPDASFLKWVWIGFAVLFFVILYPGLSGLAVSPGWASFIAKLPGGKLMYGA
ncbi:MAG: glycosyltransferase family 39 protein [Clostridiaceae bacterium]